MKNVLLVEEEAEICVLFSESFSSVATDEVKLRYVHTRDEMFEYLQYQQAPEVIILDINLQGPRGLHALKQLKAEPQLKGIPVVILSASQNPKDLIASYQYGCAAFIRKPLALSEIKELALDIYLYWFNAA